MSLAIPAPHCKIGQSYYPSSIYISVHLIFRIVIVNQPTKMPCQNPTGKFIQTAYVIPNNLFYSFTLETAPPAGTSNGFPFMYTCDMNQAFQLMADLQLREGQKDPQNQFGKIFPATCRYKRSTYSDHWRAWEHAKGGVLRSGQVDDSFQRAIDSGRTVPGKWAPIVAKYAPRTRR